jgi:N-acetylglucosaminyl-diphospho-decaprenol L-rhamnosyltransferase
MSEGVAPTAAMRGAPRLSIVVLSWNTCELLAACLQSLKDAGGLAWEDVIVVDNASEDGSAEMVAERFGDELRLVRNGVNEGYAIGNDIGATHAHGQYLLLLNSDTEVEAGVLERLVTFLDEHPQHGACAPRLVHPDGEVQLSCMAFPRLVTAVFFDTWFDRWFPGNREIPRYFMADFDHLTSRDVDQPPGAALMVRRDLWEVLEGFDPELWLFFNDVDLCRRLHELGWRVAYRADVAIVHHEGKSTSKFPTMGAIWHVNRLAYYRKTFGWKGALLARVMSSLRGLEEVLKLRKSGAPPEARRAVWTSVRQVWAA